MLVLLIVCFNKQLNALRYIATLIILIKISWQSKVIV
jgi:hypothetical protein